MEEVWIQIKDATRYEVSNQGRVRNIAKGNLIKPWVNDRGYCFMDLRFDDGRKKTKRLHHIVMEAFVGERPNGFQVNHRNRIKTDNRLENLEYVTSEQNVHHFMNWPGVHHGRPRRLTESQALKAIELQKEGLKPKEISSRLGIPTKYLTPALYAKTWKHLRQEF
jgi:hypothetical protein